MDHSRPRRARHWLTRIIVLVVFLWGASEAFSQLLQRSRLHSRLTARLEAAFGRPVEVGRFEFSLLPVPSLMADSITVAEDPRYGYEYFLRAESLTIRLRWQALLLGRIEFGTFTFSRPSLNLVHAADGRWNLESWLPRPSAMLEPAAPAGTTTGPMPPASIVPRLRRIDVDGGRINFKRGNEKLPFALVDVTGRVEQESSGRWRIDLEAHPMRAAVVAQESAPLRLSGVVGGTSARLRPADLELTWQDASIPYVLRLLRGHDYGLRGAGTLLLAAHSVDPHWSVTASAQFRRIHRWNLPLRADNPAFNVNVSATWAPELSRVEVLQALVEAPRSNLRAAGFFSWERPPGAPVGPEKDARLVLFSAGIRLDDLLAWYRAFQPNVAEELAVGGTVGMDVTLAGWPPQIEKGALVASGARLEGGSLPEPLRLGRGIMRFDRSGAKLDPVTLTIGRADGAIRFEAAADREPQWRWDIKAGGQADKVGDLIDAAAVLGWPLPRGWDIEGPARFDLEWQRAANPFQVPPLGKIELNGLAVDAPFLNRPINQIKALVDLRADGLRVKLDAAQAFGAHWSGSLEKRSGEPAWGFSLSADRLSGAELDHWLNPQWREGLLERVLPMLRPSAIAETLPAGFEARGQLRVDSFALAPLELRRVRGVAALQGRLFELTDADADFFGGTLHGSALADFSAEPSYRVDAKYQGVNLIQLVGDTATLKGLYGGTANGQLALTTRGLGRQSLINSLEGAGFIGVRNAEVRGLDVEASLRAGDKRLGISKFWQVMSNFSLRSGRVQIEKIWLRSIENETEDSEEIEGSGSVDFSRNLNLRLSLMRRNHIFSAERPGSPGTPLRYPSGTQLGFTGPLDSLQVVHLAAERKTP